MFSTGQVQIPGKTRKAVAFTLPTRRTALLILAAVFVLPVLIGFVLNAVYVNGVADADGLTIPEAVVKVDDMRAVDAAAEARKMATEADARADAAEAAAERAKVRAAAQATSIPQSAPQTATAPIAGYQGMATFCTTQTGAGGSQVRTCVDLPVDPATGLPMVQGAK